MAKVPYLYSNFVATLSYRFESALSRIQAVYNFDYGDEFEVAICQVLRAAIPHRFGICRGHVVNAAGEHAGDDIIIYDRSLFPTLRLLGDEDYSRKEWIPIEAVAAYIEAKHTLQIVGDVKKACSQVAAVKALCSHRTPIGLEQITRGVSLGYGARVVGSNDLPPLRNPVYGMIISRSVRFGANDPILKSPQEILDGFVGTEFAGPHYTDSIVAGSSNVVLPGKPVHDGKLELRFLTYGHDVTLHPLLTLNVAFGVGLCTLLAVLDLIQLGTLPWEAILNDALKPERNYVVAGEEDGSGI
jgi:hypothetical protein